MSALHEALRSLGPTNFEADVPDSPEELDEYLKDIFHDAQLILDSIPISDPDKSLANRTRSHTIAATSAAEILTSDARTEPPAPDRIALQKEWGKPIKLGAKENSLGMSVYKAAGKDGKGAWFARRSVHEGLGFDRFKHAFEAEFPTSLAVQGAPGEGNIRGIGAETKVVDTSTPSHGKVQVYRLSAQFPGPTTPRDFVTLLLTSSKALKAQKEGELVPRHYMIVSKPCDHTETQPRTGFIRGQYESVEFIREIPRKLKASASTTDLSHLGHKHGHSMEQDVLIHNAEKQTTLQPGGDDGSREVSPSARRRSQTVAVPEGHSPSRMSLDQRNPDENPVEWIMVTRSDPGGSVPRFMVERGTPGSICADAVKFLDWACQQDGDNTDTPQTPHRPPVPFRRESATSFAREKNLLRVNKEDERVPQTMVTAATPIEPRAPDQSGGIFASVTGAMSAYAPQMVQQYLPQAQENATNNDSYDASGKQKDGADDDDASSTLSSTLSFASADSHFSGDDVLTSPTASMTSGLSNSKTPQTAHEKELAKLSARRAALESKHAATIAKMSNQSSEATAKEAANLKRAEEKHARELKKQEERYQKEVQKLEERKKKEAQKIETRKKRQGEKDEKDRFRQERDDLKEKVQVMERERELFMQQIGDLQAENTTLMAKLGRAEGLRNRSTSDVVAKDSDSAKSLGLQSKSSRSSTPTGSPPVPGAISKSATTLTDRQGLGRTTSSASNLRPALGAHQRTISSDSLSKVGIGQTMGIAMDQFGNRFKSMTLQTFGVEEDKGGVNRSRSGSLFKKKEKDAASTPKSGLEKTDVPST